MDFSDIINDQSLSHDEKLSRIRYRKVLNTYSQDEKCCLDEDSVRYVVTHGAMLDQLVTLSEGYKIIFLAKFGNCILKRPLDEVKIKELYARGNTLFEENDTKPVLTDEGNKIINHFKRINEPKGHFIEPTLFVGGQKTKFKDINGVEHNIPTEIPNVSFQFFGTLCNNTDMPNSCMITCISKGENPYDVEANCDKYFNQTTDLLNILLNEGKGTYILETCLPYNEPNEILLDYLKYSLIIKDLSNAKTRSQHRRLLGAINTFENLTPEKIDMDVSSFGKKKPKSKNKKVNPELKRLRKNT